jgi:hypothetical protein
MGEVLARLRRLPGSRICARISLWTAYRAGCGIITGAPAPDRAIVGTGDVRWQLAGNGDRVMPRRFNNGRIPIAVRVLRSRASMEKNLKNLEDFIETDVSSRRGKIAVFDRLSAIAYRETETSAGRLRWTFEIATAPR